MKRIFALIIAVLTMFSSLGVFAQTDFLTEVYNNYTGDYSLKISFESSEEIAALLSEAELLDEFEKYVDLKNFLASILSLDTQMQLQLEASEDMQSVKMALTAETSRFIDINKNLNADVNAKAGMWITMDISDKENPVMAIICSSPFLNKYMVIDVFEAVTDEEKTQIVSSLSTVMNREFLVSVNTYCTQVLKKYADIKISSGKCFISIDNEAQIKILDEIVPYIMQQITEKMLNVTENAAAALEVPDELGQISFDGLQLLGDKGIKYTYTLANGKISKIEVDADICIDISKIYTALTGEEWEFISSGKMKFSLTSEGNITKTGTTRAELPDITEENSFKISDEATQYEEYYEYGEYAQYPSLYVGGWTETMPVIDGEVFVPLRSVIENAYGEAADISFADGVVTVVSEYFPGFTTLTLTAGSDTVYTELGGYMTKTVFIENGVTYVSSKLFEELFAWELTEASRSYVTGIGYYEFYTREW